MPIRKKGDVEIQASANGTKVRQTGYTFYSYDKNAAALYFQFREQDGQPTDLSKATVHLVMILDDDNGKKFIPGDYEIEVISAIRGTAKYVLPDNLLGYEGKVTSYVYLDFSDGSHTDEGQFSFRIRRSLITDVIPEAGDKYVKDFEDIKAEVQEAADGAKETISQKVTEVSDASDSAISKANQVAKTADQAQGDIQTSVSDVQSRQAGAEKDIAGLVESTESARDEAAKTMNEIDYSNRNLITGTSGEWQETTWSDWSASRISILLQNTKLLVGDTITLSVDIDNTVDKENESNVRSEIVFYDTDKNSLKQNYGNLIYPGENSVSVVTAKIPEGTYRISVFRLFKGDGSDTKTARARKSVLNRGAYPADWSLNPAEVATKSELTKIKQAIIDLGGSV